MSITNPKKISPNSKRYSLTFINKSNPLARSNINGTIDTVNDIQRPDLRINKDL